MDLKNHKIKKQLEEKRGKGSQKLGGKKMNRIDTWTWCYVAHSKFIKDTYPIISHVVLCNNRIIDYLDNYFSYILVMIQVVLGISSFLIEPMCRRLGSRFVWAMSNLIVFVCMAGTAVISLISVGEYSEGIEHVIGGNAPIRIAALIVFALLGFPLAVCSCSSRTSLYLSISSLNSM